ncbi:MAG TPA: hypothetical protein PK800_06785, partial [Syntrophorhabdaceae bacterium]|nr:hypothetical protein [Syntrophorhabdaceae bacterium]
NAHVWVEAFIENKGWMRFDPTPATYEAFSFGRKRDKLLQIRLIMDTINFYWNAFVINYNLDRQLFIIFSITKGIKRPQLRLNTKILTFIKYMVAFLLMVFFVYFIVKTILKRQNREEYLISKFYKRLNKYGYKKRQSQGLEEFVSCIDDDRIRLKAWEFVRQFEGIYYRDKRLGKADIKTLKGVLKDI